jgi:hypothetical protein
MGEALKGQTGQILYGKKHSHFKKLFFSFNHLEVFKNTYLFTETKVFDVN